MLIIKRACQEQIELTGTPSVFLPPDIVHDTTQATLAEELCAEYHVAPQTVRKYAVYASMIDQLYDAEPAFAKKLLRGEIYIGHESLAEVTAMNAGELVQLSKYFLESTERRPSYSKYKAMIKALVESMNLTLSATSSPGTICAVSTLEEIYAKHGYHVLDRVLRICVGTWEDEINSLSSNMLRGITRMVVAFGDEMRDDLFKEKVGRYSAKEISRQARDRRAGSLGYAEATLIAYNAKLKNRLRWANLYNKKAKVSADLVLMDMPFGGESDDMEGN